MEDRKKIAIVRYFIEEYGLDIKEPWLEVALTEENSFTNAINRMKSLELVNSFQKMLKVYDPTKLRDIIDLEKKYLLLLENDSDVAVNGSPYNSANGRIEDGEIILIKTLHNDRTFTPVMDSRSHSVGYIKPSLNNYKSILVTDNARSIPFILASAKNHYIGYYDVKGEAEVSRISWIYREQIKRAEGLCNKKFKLITEANGDETYITVRQTNRNVYQIKKPK